ncbi:MAG TPA: acyl-CoA dehydrogenase [Acidimicrobiales bacterium]|nr:acyl-CoA dehydrogenase [Acidimicrobiales bacterium]
MTGSPLRALLDEASSPADVRRTIASRTGWDSALWRALAEAGVLSADRPLTALSEVGEELGAALACVPYLSTVVLAGTALAVCGGEETTAEHLPAIASGSVVATLAVTEDGGRWEEDGLRTVARAGDHPGGHVLDGHKSYVLDGCAADLVLVAAKDETGTGLFAVAGNAPGLTRSPLVPLDLTRPLARLELDGVPAHRVGRPGDGWRVVTEALDRAAVVLAAEAVGGAQRCLDMATARARGRVQFGRPIGSFQAVQHKLADVLVGVEAARSVVAAAATAVDRGDEARALLASAAKAYSTEAFVAAASENIQVHGGLGFTWDHDAHLYLKRARASALLLGAPAWHRERVARLLGL